MCDKLEVIAVKAGRLLWGETNCYAVCNVCVVTTATRVHDTAVFAEYGISW